MKLISTVYLPLLLLILSFGIFFSNYAPYRPCSPELVAPLYTRNNSDQAQPETRFKGPSLEQWRWSRTARWEAPGGSSQSGRVVLPGGIKGGSYVLCTLENPRQWKYLRFTCRIRTENVQNSENPGSTVRPLLYFKDAQKKPHWEHPHTLCSLSGNHEWKTYTRVFSVPDYAVAARVLIQNRGASGIAYVEDISVVGASKKKSVPWINISAGLIWFGVLILLLRVNKIRRLSYNWAVMGLIGLIVIGVIIPQPVINTLAEKSKKLILALPGYDDQKPVSKLKNKTINGNHTDPGSGSWIESPLGILKHVGHLSLFALICFFLNLAYKKKNTLPSNPKNRDKPTPDLVSIVSTGFGLALFAGATEVLQFISETRQPSLIDWLFDLTGIIVGLTVYVIYKGVRIKNRG